MLKLLLIKISVGQCFLPVIYFVGCNFDHLPNILSLLSDQNIPDKVCFFTVLRGFQFFFQGASRILTWVKKTHKATIFFNKVFSGDGFHQVKNTGLLKVHSQTLRLYVFVTMTKQSHKYPLEVFCKKRWSQKFCKIHTYRQLL